MWKWLELITQELFLFTPIWFIRQVGWERWHKRVHQEDKARDERTYAAVMQLTDKISHLSNALIDYIPLHDAARRELLDLFQPPERNVMPIEQYNSPNWSPRFGFKVKFIVVHWFGTGDLESATKRFMSWLNIFNRVSAHYAVSNTTVRQFVSEDRAAWHAGNWTANLESIGIEHDGTLDRPNISDDTYHTSGQLLAEIHLRHNLGRPSYAIDNKGQQTGTIRPHKAFRPTQCPGTLDLGRLADIAGQRYDELTKPAPVMDAVQAAPAPDPSPAPDAPSEFPKKVQVTSDAGLMVREAPTSQSKFINPDNHQAPFLQSAANKTKYRLAKGTSFTVVERVQGETVDGNSNWLKTKFGHFVWQGGVS